ncbi:hypothetical protein [Stenotrophomonas rhizophila]
MSAKIQQFGRAAAIRALLLDLPAGASVEELLAAGTLACTLKQLNSSLAAMRDTGQVQASITKGNRVWMLTATMHRLMRNPDARVEPTRAAVARVMRSAPTGSHNSTTVQHKDRDRAEIADQLAAFKSAGGKVEILGNTPVRQELSRRQINDASAASRAATRH